MTRICVFFIFLAFPFMGSSQELPAKPFLIHGQIQHCPENQLALVYDDTDGHHVEIIPTDRDGKFDFKTDKIFGPGTAKLNFSNGFSTGLYIAPGYALSLTCDAEDFHSFIVSKKIEGTGAESNRFVIIRDSLLWLRRDSIEWFHMNAEQLLRFEQENKRLKDSIFHEVFDREPADDPWFGYFARMTRLDNRFMQLYYLINNAIDDTGFTYAQTISFVRDHFNQDTLDHLYKEDYLISDAYREWLIKDYPLYLRTLDCRKNPSSCNDKQFKVELVEEVGAHYTGRIRNLMLENKIGEAITYCRSFDEWNRYRAAFPRYIDLLPDQKSAAALDTLLARKGNELIRSQVGRPAPFFSARDSMGKTYTLENFKGKVIYLDLWGSWCGPCRQLTPYYQKLYDKYKNDGRIVCISIAVFDKAESWKAALREDKPTWLQLLDEDGSVHSAYVANSVPKFILISKAGNIVSFDAPMPDSPDIGQLLQQEMAK